MTVQNVREFLAAAAAGGAIAPAVALMALRAGGRQPHEAISDAELSRLFFAANEVALAAQSPEVSAFPLLLEVFTPGGRQRASEKEAARCEEGL